MRALRDLIDFSKSGEADTGTVALVILGFFVAFFIFVTILRIIKRTKQ